MVQVRIQVFWKGVVGFLWDDHAYKRNHFSRTNKQFFLINLIDQGCHMQLSIVFHINNIDFPCPFSLRTLLLLLVIVFFISGEQRSIEKSSRILLYKSSSNVVNSNSLAVIHGNYSQVSSHIVDRAKVFILLIREKVLSASALVIGRVQPIISRR